MPATPALAGALPTAVTADHCFSEIVGRRAIGPGSNSFADGPDPAVRMTILPSSAVRRCQTFLTGGIFHVPSMIDGAFSSGQYMRSIRMNLPAGAGSQFDSLSAPGESF